jgi:hypothetical protein
MAAEGPHGLAWCLGISVLVGCNIENRLGDAKDAEDPVDSGAVEDSEPLVEEECNGVDDDGDGLVDEDFADDDGNGRADCLDVECPELVIGLAGDVPFSDACAAPGLVEEPWNVEQLWAFERVPSTDAYNAYASPVIVQLDDDDGDGDIDGDDVPEVLVTVFQYGNDDHWFLVLLDGQTGILKWALPGFSPYSYSTVVDVDGDGAPEVLAWGIDERLRLVSPNGVVQWVGPELTSSPPEFYGVLPVDLEGDGTIEVIADSVVLDGQTGSTLFDLGEWVSGHRMATAGDIDLDGRQEIILDGLVFDAEGQLLWSTGAQANMITYALLLQLDDDEEAELLFIADDVLVFEHDGSLATRWNLGISELRIGTPAVGDIDGDGASELIIPTGVALQAYELDGTLLWEAAVDDYTSAAGASLYDLDGDGALEVLYADMYTFWIYDGRTGAILFEDTEHWSWTGFETPAVGDVDGDGSAEIVTIRNETTSCVVAYQHAGEGWLLGSRSWPHWEYQLDTFTEDGGLVWSYPWLEHNSLRAGPLGNQVRMLADLTVSVTDLCVADCDYGPVELAVQVSNRGYLDVESGLTLTVSADDCTATTVLQQRTLPAITAGHALDGEVFELQPSDWGSCGLFVDVIAETSLEECSESSNGQQVKVDCP